jgi:TusA-related sulfurtransferase
MKRLEINGRTIKVAATVDAVGLYCPMPIIMLSKELGKLNSKQVVEILADDEPFQIDVADWCTQTHNRLLSISKTEEDIFIAYVERE